jgi:hypothetical protein
VRVRVGVRVGLLPLGQRREQRRVLALREARAQPTQRHLHLLPAQLGLALLARLRVGVGG